MSLDFSPSEVFQFADTWPVGSFRLKTSKDLPQDMVSSFDVPCWPELTGAGESEELVGFWLPLYLEWEKSSCDEVIEKALKNRPGLKLFSEQFSSQPLPLLKGQMIGPLTLVWALKKNNHPMIDRQRVFEFIWSAFRAQGYLLARLANKVIISFDEPCAFLESMRNLLWEDFFRLKPSDQAFGIALHSCGPVDHEVLNFQWNVVHFDYDEFQASYRADEEKWKQKIQNFFENNQWLALGIVRSSVLAEKTQVESLARELEEWLEKFSQPKVLLSSSCGFGDSDWKSIKEKIDSISQVSQVICAKSVG